MEIRRQFKNFLYVFHICWYDQCIGFIPFNIVLSPLNSAWVNVDFRVTLRVSRVVCRRRSSTVSKALECVSFKLSIAFLISSLLWRCVARRSLPQTEYPSISCVPDRLGVLCLLWCCKVLGLKQGPSLPNTFTARLAAPPYLWPRVYWASSQVLVFDIAARCAANFTDMLVLSEGPLGIRLLTCFPDQGNRSLSEIWLKEISTAVRSRYRRIYQNGSLHPIVLDATLAERQTFEEVLLLNALDDLKNFTDHFKDCNWIRILALLSALLYQFCKTLVAFFVTRILFHVPWKIY